MKYFLMVASLAFATQASASVMTPLGQSAPLEWAFQADPTEVFPLAGSAKFDGVTLVARDSMVYVSILVTFADGSHFLDRGIHLKQNGAHFFGFSGQKEISKISVSGSSSEPFGKNGHVEIYGGKSGNGSFDGFDDFHPR